MTHSTIDILGALFFGGAVLHTFLVGHFGRWAQRYPKDFWQHSVLHLLGEVEVVFAIWAAFFMALFIGLEGWQEAMAYQSSLSFVEPFFIFVIMTICSTRPVLSLARKGILGCSSLLQKAFGTHEQSTDLFVILILGPLSGSFITEPAAMTVTALMINSVLHKPSQKLLYVLLAVLFVNVSIGGALTPFAAPPILMVAKKWNWDFAFIFASFGWKSALAIAINTLAFLIYFRAYLKKEFLGLREVETRMSGAQAEIPAAVSIIHFIFLVAVILTAHYQNAFMGLFLLFLGVAGVTKKYQDSLRLKESLLVAMFLGGIIQFGAFQKWWLTPLLENIEGPQLYGGALLLTGITDNAALTYLGSQVAGLSDLSKYALVAGAIAGGGLTLIANAPNAAGFAILRNKFIDGLNPIYLLVASLIPTSVAVACLWFL